MYVIFQSHRPHQIRSEPLSAWRLSAPHSGQSRSSQIIETPLDDGQGGSEGRSHLHASEPVGADPLRPIPIQTPRAESFVSDTARGAFVLFDSTAPAQQYQQSLMEERTHNNLFIFFSSLSNSVSAISSEVTPVITILPVAKIKSVQLPESGR